ncbi:MAG: hypothetical protein GEV03_15975 [Streptosporangiales bacterium]|nr:hypothetical protein [Streptosporangiales bacterium]
MKFLIMVQGTQALYDAMAGKAADGKTWTQEELAAMYGHMEALNNDLAERGEMVDGQGLVEPKQARLVSAEDGVPVVSDGPYGETKEVVVGYWVVDVENIDRAVEIAARAYECPVPSWLTNPPPLVVHQIQESPEATDS